MNRHWETAREHLRATSCCHDQGLYSASVTRSYYSAYQAMWIALGDPVTDQWKNGINTAFEVLQLVAKQNGLIM